MIWKRQHTSCLGGGLLAATMLCIAPLSDAEAQSINTSQLFRILGGETIPEQDDAHGENGEEFTDEFFLGECNFARNGRNLFFSLEPGYQLALAGDDDGEFVELFITALNEVHDVYLDINGELKLIRTRVVEEREFADGELVEISLNFYSRCTATGDIFYFGEFVCDFEDGNCVAADDAWISGFHEARPGIIMPGRYLLGARYFQEVAPDVALDRARHSEMGLTVKTPGGTFHDCVAVIEDSPLEPGSESEKIYAPGVGFIKDGDVVLQSFGFIGEPLQDVGGNESVLSHHELLDFVIERSTLSKDGR